GVLGIQGMALSGDSVVSGNVFRGCRTEYDLVDAWGALEFRDNELVDNVASPLLGTEYTAEGVVVSGNQFVDNVGVPHLLAAESSSPGLDVVGNEFRGNVAAGALLDLAYATAGSSFVDNVVVDNVLGAAILARGSDVSVVHGLFVGNLLWSNEDAALISVLEDSAAVVDQCTIAGNVSADGTDPVIRGADTPTVMVRNTAIIGHEGGPAIESTGVQLAYNLFSDNLGGDLASGGALPATNLAADPGLAVWRPGAPAQAQDLVPVPGSALIDAGDPAVLDLDGTVSDIGWTGGPTADLALALDEDGDGSSARFDCDDTDADRRPGAPELCDDIDQDCDLDPHTGTVYADADADGAGDAAAPIVGNVCEPGAAAAAGDDCDDGDATVAPGATETCDGRDEDCDGSIDEGVRATVYPDDDGDGLGDTAGAFEGCPGLDGVAEGGDCDDSDPARTTDCDGTTGGGGGDDDDDGGSSSGDGEDEAGGCGGCASGGTAGPGWTAGVVLAALALRRRGRWLAVAAAVGGCAETGGTSQQARPTDPDPVRPAPAGGRAADVDADADGFTADVDCDDDDAAVFPGAPDLCGDDRVTDCDRASDDGLVTVDGVDSTVDLATALSWAVDGSEVRVCPGTWVGTFVAAVPLTLVAQGGSEDTVLDAVDQGTTLTVQGGTTVSGFTVTRGLTVAAGGGIALAGPGTLTVERSVVADNRANVGAGIAVPAGGTLVLRDGVRIERNLAFDGGGGVHAANGATLDLGDATLADNDAQIGGGVLLEAATLTGGLVTGNFARAHGGGVALLGSCTARASEWTGNFGAGSGWDPFGGPGHGGGFYAADGASSLTDVWVHDNGGLETIAGGGAIASGSVSLLGTTAIEANVGSQAGGLGLYLATVTGGRIVDNVAPIGAGVFLDSSTLDGAEVTGNVATNGGGVYARTGTVVGCTITQNTADDGGGVAGFDGLLEVRDSTVSGNAAASGAGVWISFGDGTITGSTLADNVATQGAAVYVVRSSFGPASQVELVGSTVVRNTADRGGGAFLEDGRLDSTDTSWGTGADDNLLDDVFAGGLGWTGYGDAATFLCGDAGCSPAP
ncbi:MAG: right-handed parallel beta-helix repeat-containing protein, partial [Myxococcota bacterium]